MHLELLEALFITEVSLDLSAYQRAENACSNCVAD